MAATMLAVGLVFECDRLAVSVLLVLGQTIYAVQFSGYPVTALDVAPVYAGTLPFNIILSSLLFKVKFPWLSYSS